MFFGIKCWCQNSNNKKEIVLNGFGIWRTLILEEITIIACQRLFLNIALDYRLEWVNRPLLS